MLLQVYIIYQIHIRLPLRNDLAEMEAIPKRTYNKLSAEDKKAKNWLIVEKGKMWMSLNKFKTVSKYEELRFDVPKDQLSQTLIKYSKRYMNGKSISTTMLRKIVLSDKFAGMKKEQEELSKVTGHSVATMNDVYIKEGQGDTEGKGKVDKS